MICLLLAIVTYFLKKLAGSLLIDSINDEGP